jgi:hypothetical protein
VVERRRGELVEVGAHGPACSCQHCRGFPTGVENPGKLSHGAYSSALRLRGRAEEIEAAIRESLPNYSPSDEASISLLSLTLVRVERASEALDMVHERTQNALGPYAGKGADSFERLRRDLRSWISLAARLSDRLGLSPASRVSLGADLVAAEAGLARLAERGRELRLAAEDEGRAG